MNQLKITINNVTRFLKYDTNLYFSEHYICGWDDLYDLGFSVKDCQENDIIVESDGPVKFVIQKKENNVNKN